MAVRQTSSRSVKPGANPGADAGAQRGLKQGARRRPERGLESEVPEMPGVSGVPQVRSNRLEVVASLPARGLVPLADGGAPPDAHDWGETEPSVNPRDVRLAERMRLVLKKTAEENRRFSQGSSTVRLDQVHALGSGQAWMPGLVSSEQELQTFFQKLRQILYDETAEQQEEALPNGRLVPLPASTPASSTLASSTLASSTPSESEADDAPSDKARPSVVPPAFLPAEPKRETKTGLSSRLPEPPQGSPPAFPLSSPVSSAPGASDRAGESSPRASKSEPDFDKLVRGLQRLRKRYAATAAAPPPVSPPALGSSVLSGEQETPAVSPEVSPENPVKPAGAAAVAVAASAPAEFPAESESRLKEPLESRTPAQTPAQDSEENPEQDREKKPSQSVKPTDESGAETGLASGSQGSQGESRDGSQDVRGLSVPASPSETAAAGGLEEDPVVRRAAELLGLDPAILKDIGPLPPFPEISDSSGDPPGDLPGGPPPPREVSAPPSSAPLASGSSETEADASIASIDPIDPIDAESSVVSASPSEPAREPAVTLGSPAAPGATRLADPEHSEQPVPEPTLAPSVSPSLDSVLEASERHYLGQNLVADSEEWRDSSGSPAALLSPLPASQPSSPKVGSLPAGDGASAGASVAGSRPASPESPEAAAKSVLPFAPAAAPAYPERPTEAPDDQEVARNRELMRSQLSGLARMIRGSKEPLSSAGTEPPDPLPGDLAAEEVSPEQAAGPEPPGNPENPGAKKTDKASSQTSSPLSHAGRIKKL